LAAFASRRSKGFCEAAFRLLESITSGQHTPLGVQLDTDKLIQRLARLPQSSYPDSIRLHIPRALRVVYDVRNKRDAAHLADGIDPNLQDATLVISIVDWILAEFIRLYHKVLPDEATSMVEAIVSRAAPTVQDFAGFLKVLCPGLGASDHVLLLLYQRGREGAEFEKLKQWVRPSMRGNLRRTLDRLTHSVDLVHFEGHRYVITRRGELDVEKRKLLEQG
jgi:hypothetical protein